MDFQHRESFQRNSLPFDLRSKYDTAKHGGAVLMGVNAPVVKTHGRSNERPIYYTLKQIDKILDEKLIDEFKQSFSNKREN